MERTAKAPHDHYVEYNPEGNDDFTADPGYKGGQFHRVSQDEPSDVDVHNIEALRTHLIEDHPVRADELDPSNRTPLQWHQGFHAGKNNTHWHVGTSVWDQHSPDHTYVANIGEVPYFKTACSCGWKSNIRSSRAADHEWSNHFRKLDEESRLQKAGPPKDRSNIPTPKRYATRFRACITCGGTGKDRFNQLPLEMRDDPDLPRCGQCGGSGIVYDRDVVADRYLASKHSAFRVQVHDQLYPPLFDGQQMLPRVRAALRMFLVKTLIAEGLQVGDWLHLTAYGSGISYNWDEAGDLDVQVWADPKPFHAMNQQVDAGQRLRTAITKVNFHPLKDIAGSGAMAVQYYLHEGQGTPEQIKAKKPYAAYDIDLGHWVTVPGRIDQEFYEGQFKEPGAIASLIRDAATSSLKALHDKVIADDRRGAEEAKWRVKRTFDHVMQLRDEAYSPTGKGIRDWRDTVHKLLEEWGVFDALQAGARSNLPWQQKVSSEHPSEYCSRCEGYGRVPIGYTVCGNCFGTGIYTHNNVKEKCDGCGGAGLFFQKAWGKCADCGGEGVLPAQTELTREAHGDNEHYVDEETGDLRTHSEEEGEGPGHDEWSAGHHDYFDNKGNGYDVQPDDYLIDVTKFHDGGNDAADNLMAGSLGRIRARDLAWQKDRNNGFEPDAVEDCSECTYGTKPCTKCDQTGFASVCRNCKGDKVVHHEACGGRGSFPCENCTGGQLDKPEYKIHARCDGCGCKGCGFSGLHLSSTCGDCRGFGRIDDPNCHGGTNSCPKCGGTGGKQCNSCKGVGSTECTNCASEGIIPATLKDVHHQIWKHQHDSGYYGQVWHYKGYGSYDDITPCEGGSTKGCTDYKDWEKEFHAGKPEGKCCFCKGSGITHYGEDKTCGNCGGDGKACAECGYKVSKELAKQGKIAAMAGPGTAYLLHFDRPISDVPRTVDPETGKVTGHTTQHYIGWAEPGHLDSRIEQHRSGQGARLTEVAKEKGIGFDVVRTWENVDRNFERTLKNRKMGPRMCPTCMQARKGLAKKKASPGQFHTPYEACLVCAVSGRPTKSRCRYCKDSGIVDINKLPYDTWMEYDQFRRENEGHSKEPSDPMNQKTSHYDEDDPDHDEFDEHEPDDEWDRGPQEGDYVIDDNRVHDDGNSVSEAKSEGYSYDSHDHSLVWQHQEFGRRKAPAGLGLEWKNCERCSTNGYENCDHCGGTGLAEEEKWRTCGRCKGDGTDGAGGLCKSCTGSGLVHDAWCEHCFGSGRKHDSQGNELSCPDCDGEGSLGTNQEDIHKQIRKHMERTKFFPSVWHTTRPGSGDPDDYTPCDHWNQWMQKESSWFDHVTKPYQQDAVAEPKDGIEPKLPRLYEEGDDPEFVDEARHPADVFGNPKTGWKSVIGQYVNQQPVPRPPMQHYVCDRCDGTGRRGDDMCDSCRGSGISKFVHDQHCEWCNDGKCSDSHSYNQFKGPTLTVTCNGACIFCDGMGTLTKNSLDGLRQLNVRKAGIKRIAQVTRTCVMCTNPFSESEHGEATGFCQSCREAQGMVTHHSWSDDAQAGHYGGAFKESPSHRRAEPGLAVPSPAQPGLASSMEGYDNPTRHAGYYKDILGDEAIEKDYDPEEVPRYVYRTMSEDHFQKSLSEGVHQSDERGNWKAQYRQYGDNPDEVPDEGTVASRWPSPGYLMNSPSEVGRIVKIKVHPEDGWEVHPDVEEGDYIRTFKPIPTDRFVAWTDPISAKDMSTPMTRDDNRRWQKDASIKPTWKPIVEHAKHYDDFNEFKHDFQLRNYHGTYWHLTDKPDFAIDPNQSPRDASSMGSGEGGAPGLMVSTDPENWHATLGKGRQYAAQIDLSAAKPNVDFKDTTRGFGHEIYVFTPEKARVVRVMPYDNAVKKVNRLYHGGQLPQSEEELQTIWDQAHRERTSMRESARRIMRTEDLVRNLAYPLHTRDDCARMASDDVDEETHYRPEEWDAASAECKGGIKQPIEAGHFDDGIWIVDGHHRLAWAVEQHLPTVPVYYSDKRTARARQHNGGVYDRSGVRTKEHPDFLFHVTHPRNRESIQQLGLDGTQFGHSGPNPAGNYFREPDTEYFQDDLRYPGHDIWKVDVRDMPLEADSSDNDRSWFSKETVPPQRLELMRSAHYGSVDDPWNPPDSVWHLTNDPDFKINSDVQATRPSGKLGPKGVLYTTQEPATWLRHSEYLRGRTHAAEIEIDPSAKHGVDFYLNVHGVMPEVIITNLAKARVRRVIPVRDIQEGHYGAKNDDEPVKMMDTAEVARKRHAFGSEYCTQNTCSEYEPYQWDQMVQDVAENGVKKPIDVYAWNDDSFDVEDGNHRISWAEEAGIPQVPVRFRDTKEKLRWLKDGAVTADRRRYPQDEARKGVRPLQHPAPEGKQEKSAEVERWTSDIKAADEAFLTGPKLDSYHTNEDQHDYSPPGGCKNCGQQGEWYGPGYKAFCPSCRASWTSRWEEFSPGTKTIYPGKTDEDDTMEDMEAQMGQGPRLHMLNNDDGDDVVHIGRQSSRFGMPRDDDFLKSLTYKHRHLDSDSDQHRLTAYDPEGSVAGYIDWAPGEVSPEQQNIQMISVLPRYQRHGLATEMWHRALEHEPNLRHSWEMSGDGMGWARTLDLESKNHVEHLDDFADDSLRFEGGTP